MRCYLIWADVVIKNSVFVKISVVITVAHSTSITRMFKSFFKNSSLAFLKLKLYFLRFGSPILSDLTRAEASLFAQLLLVSAGWPDYHYGYSCALLNEGKASIIYFWKKIVILFAHRLDFSYCSRPWLWLVLLATGLECLVWIHRSNQTTTYLLRAWTPDTGNISSPQMADTYTPGSQEKSPSRKRSLSIAISFQPHKRPRNKRTIKHDYRAKLYYEDRLGHVFYRLRPVYK